jgi:hypothetical protein
MHGVVYAYKLKYSLDNISWFDVDGGTTFSNPSRGPNKIGQHCDHPIRISNFSSPVIARHIRVFPLS